MRGQLEFDRLEEAAAFVAALSRFLASPPGAPYAHADVPAGVWGAANPGRATMIWLNDSALAATREGFGTPPDIKSVSDLEPTDSALQILDGSSIEALGRDDVIRRLSLDSH